MVIEMQEEKEKSEMEKAAQERLQKDMKVFDDVKSGIALIKRNCTFINELKNQSNKEVNVDAFKGASQTHHL